MKHLTLISSILILPLLLASQPNKTKSLLSSDAASNVLSNYSNLSSPKNILKIFSYDNNEILKGLGNRAEAYTLGTFIEIPDTSLAQYIDQEIDLIRFGIEDNSIIKNATILVYENSLENTPVLEQPIHVDSIASGWNQFYLNNPYLITGNSFFFGISVETTSGGYTQTYDSDPASYPQYSGHTVLNGDYFGTLSNEVGFDADYNIQALISDGQGTEHIDLVFSNIYPTSKGCSLSSEEILKASIVNTGEDSIYTEFELKVTINGVDLFQQVTPTTFYPNVEKVINMPTVNMSELGQYSIDASFNLNDVKPENNNYSTIINSGNATLQVDINTDNYPEDISWNLFDQFENMIARNNVFNADTYHSNKICIIDTNCYSWILNDANGDGIDLHDSIYAFNLFYNDLSLFTYADITNNFGSEFIKYGIANGCLENEIVLNKIQLPSYELPQSIPIKGTLTNNGLSTLNSFTIKYIVDDFESIVDTIMNLSVATGKSFNFEHTTPYNFENEKKYNVSVEISNLDANSDDNLSNNTLSQDIVINSNVVPQKQLIEHFTSSTNEACFNFTPQLDELLANNPDDFSLIRYHANWPENGDPYYINETGNRTDYYNVKKLPTVFTNGKLNNEYTQEVFNEFANNKTFIELIVDANYKNTTVSIDVEVNAIITSDTNLNLFIAVLENTTFNNVGTNGQTDFSNVILAFAPKNIAVTLPTIEKDNPFTYNCTYDMESTYMEEINDLSVVAFVQNNVSKQILQSINLPISQLSKIAGKFSVDKVNIYPNPFSSIININGLIEGQHALICDIYGKQIELLKPNEKEVVINTNSYKPGIYLIHIINKNGESIECKKLIKL